MPRRTAQRYCRCGTRLAADNPSDRCLACTRKDHEHLQHPPELPLEYWLTDQFDDAFTAQHLGLVSVAYRQSPFHRRPVTQERLGNWLGLSQPEISRIEAGPPVRNLDHLTYWARTIKIPPQLLWFDLPGQRRATTAGRGRQPALLQPPASHEQPAAAPGQSHHGDERHDQTSHEHGLPLPGHLAALLEAGGGLPAAGLPPVGQRSLVDAPPSPPPLSGLLTTPSDTRNLAFGDGRYEVIARFGEVLLVGVDRRLFLLRAGLAPGLAIPLADTEIVRQRLARSMLGDSWGSAEEWQAIAREYCIPPFGTPAERFIRLSADIAALGDAIEHERSESGQCELRQAGAVLAALMSSTVANLGDLSACRGWARTARHIADASGDLHTRLLVRGREVVLGLYEQRPVGELLHLAEEAIAIGQAQGPPRTAAWPFLMSGAAQALAVAGRGDEAKVALDHTRDGFDAIPDNREDGSLLSFSEPNMRYTESYIYTYLDDYDRAETAQDAALRLYLPEDQRNPAQVELMRSLCQVRAGDTTAGVTHARATISRLPHIQRIRTVVDLGQKVLEAVPAGQQHEDEAMELRELVGAGR